MYPYQINYWNIKNYSKCTSPLLFQFTSEIYFGVITFKFSDQITNTQEEL